ncbi:Efflux transporter outer membrane subunit [Rhodovastum atsumiense]|nr:Efflux transporter outer membrane subunit [Rhodovastum atsumiense]
MKTGRKARALPSTRQGPQGPLGPLRGPSPFALRGTEWDPRAFDPWWRSRRQSLLAGLGAAPRLGLVVLLAAGCTLGPDHQPPEMLLPAAWSGPLATSPTAVAQGAWWQRFHDPVLDGLITRSLAANPDVAKAQASLRAARASLAQQRAGLWPSLDASASVTEQRSSLAASGYGSGARTYGTWTAGFDADFELDVFGGQRRTIESARATAEAAAAERDATVLSLIGDVANAYVQVRGYQAQLEVARQTLATRRDTAALTRGRARAGLVSELDAVKAEAEAESAEAAIPPLEQSLAGQVHGLAVLTGAAPGELTGLMAPVRPVPTLGGAIVADAPATLLVRRPDIRAAERRLAAANAAIGAAEADRYPAVSLAGAIGLNAARLGNVTDVSSRVWSVAPQVSLPVFDAGKRAAVVAEREAERDEALASWRATVLTALKEVENALVGLDREAAHNARLRRSVRAWQDAAQLARAQYRAGLSNFLDVLDAERSLSEAQDTLAQSDTALATQAIALFKALGGGWESAT